MTRKLAGNLELEVDPVVYCSEKEHGNKNRALDYMLRAYGMVFDPVEDVLDCYLRVFSMLVNCLDLENIAFVFALHGRDLKTGEQIIPAEYTKYVNAMLATYGMYDGSGEFALKVGFHVKAV